MHAHDTAGDSDFDLIALWLRKDPKRWVAGAMAGVFAGLVAMVFAGILCVASGSEFWFAFKVPALPILGAEATTLGFHLPAIAVGLVAYSALCAVLGAVYSHFAATNAIKPLLAVGLVWGLFSWIFICNLFIQSWRVVFDAKLSSAGMLFMCLVFGLSLSTVAFFDRVIRGSR